MMDQGRHSSQDGHFVASSNYTIEPGCIVGKMYRPDCAPVRLGQGAVIRTGTIIYGDVTVGDDFQTGHNVLIREHTTLGSHIVVGSGTVIDGHVSTKDFVKIESNCYLCTHVTIGARVFLGPNVVLLNDRYPLKLRDQYRPDGPVIEDGVTVGGGVVICPGVTVGQDSFLAAGAVVTKDVPAFSMVKGSPGVITPLPEKLRERNMALSWRKYFNE